MGTRSLTRVYEDEAIINMYRQYDGYPSGHGADLFEFLNGFEIVNGLGLETPEKIANGMGCLAAQLVGHFKDGAGGIYLYPTSSDDCWQEYEYEIRHTDDGLEITVIRSHNSQEEFKGSVADFGKFCSEEDE